jgi:hypothetical protein
MSRLVRVALLVMGVIWVAACSGNQPGADQPRQAEEMVIVSVNNNLTIPTPLTIFMISEAERRVLLGTVGAARSQTFRFRNPNILGRYRLRAERSGRNDAVQSQLLTLQGGEQLDWDLRSNVVRTQQGQPVQP